MQFYNLTTEEMGTAILGIVGTIVFIGVIGFLMSLVGRATNTTFITRGGGKIHPYKTPTERRIEQQQEETARCVTQLNYFCLEFEERKIPDQSDLPPNLRYLADSIHIHSPPLYQSNQPSITSQKIIALDNMVIALQHYKDLQNLKETGIIDKEEYRRRGVMLLKKMTGEI